MLKSTHKASVAAALPPCWSEHTAPTGHKYYYNSETKESTYKRPGTEPAPQPTQYGAFPSLPDPKVANAYMAQFNPQQQQQQNRRGGHGGGGRGGFEGRPRPQPVDKPRRKEAIPGCEPWILVYTKYSRRFVYNPIKNTSYWRIPEKLMPGILELDKARIRDKTNKTEREDETQGPKEQKSASATVDRTREGAQMDGHDDDSSEYEEVEVTDEEEAGDDVDGEHPQKRQRTEQGDDSMPVEFTEDDIAMQLQAMGEAYGLDPGEYDDGDAENWPEGAEGAELSEEDAKYLFKDLLNDFNINPYSPWEKLLEEGKIVDDLRYTALTTTKARRDCWDQWTREKIAQLKEQRAKQEKQNPRIAYMALLQEKATPKLYWPEFKRKYKKETAMRDLSLSDKEREKAYREHTSRLKMPPATLKSDLTALLKAQPTHRLHNKSLVTALPEQILTDIRYISLNPEIRDPLIEALISTLPPPVDDPEAAKDDEEARKSIEARQKREKALQERSKAVEEQRRRRERDVAASKARLREGEKELEMAMRVGKHGLQSQLVTIQDGPAEGS